jgi:hypothetical protein
VVTRRVTRPQGVYNRRRPCDDGGGAKGGDGRDEREATAETKGRRRQRRKGGDGRDEREATAETKGRRLLYLNNYQTNYYIILIEAVKRI